MDDLIRQLRRWSALVDRRALGETLSPEEIAFCERFAEQHPACRREVALYEELARLDTTPDEATRTLVDGALTRLQQTQDQAREAEAKAKAGRGRPVPRGGLAVWLAASGAAAAAAAAIALSTAAPRSGESASRAPQAQPSAVGEARSPARPTHTSRVELVYVSGSVRVDGAVATGSSALLTEGSEIAVERGGACVAMDPGIDVCLDEHTRLRLTTTERAARRLDLLEGKVAVQLTPQPEGSRLSIVADGVWSTAIGTAFSVEHDGSGAGVATRVLSGRVRVGAERDHGRLVSAHQRARLDGERAEVVSLSRSDEASEWALLGPAVLWSERLSSTLELTDFPAEAELLLDGRAIGLAPLSSVIPVGAHRLEVRIDGEVQMRRDFLASAGVTTRLRFEPVARDDVRPAVRAQRGMRGRDAEPEAAEAPPNPPAPAMLAQARQLLRSGDFHAAAERYAALREIHPTSPEARTVLVSLAQLELERLGHPRRALSNVERYLASGHGDLAQEARLMRIRALRALGEERLEREAIEEFLHLHPRSFQTAGLTRRLSELQKEPQEAP